MHGRHVAVQIHAESHAFDVMLFSFGCIEINSLSIPSRCMADMSRCKLMQSNHIASIQLQLFSAEISKRFCGRIQDHVAESQD